MSTHIIASALGTTGDTVKTKIDDTTLPANAKKITGIAVTALGGATMTTGETPMGIVDLESNDFPESLMPLQIPTAAASILTSGAVALEPRFIPVNIPCKGQEKISSYITMQMAQTGALTARVWYMYES